MIVLSGMHGTDATSVLVDISRRCSGVRPCVLRDLGGGVDVRPYEIAAQVAYGLSERVRQFGELQFPRLLLGMVVVGSGIDRYDRPRARTELQTLLFGKHRRMIDTIRDVGGSVLDEVDAPAGTKTILGLALDGIAAMARTVRVLRGGAFRWYCEGLGQRFDDPLDALIELYSWEIDGTRKTRAAVDETLCRAFLADLRAAFRDDVRARQRTGNCVALLDNADSLQGQTFLQLLVAARHAAHAQEGCDPLLVVAAGHTRFPVFARRDGHEPQPRSPKRASYTDWASNRDGSAESWLYPVRLDGADDRDRAVVVRHISGAAAVPDAETFADRLTGGHPAGLRLVLRAVSNWASEVKPQNVDLRDILDRPDPDNPEFTVGDAAVDILLPGVASSLRRDLTTCAAPSGVGPAARRHALGQPDDAGSVELDRFCGIDLCVKMPDGTAQAVLHPFLRRVLLHALAARRDNEADDWHTVHTRLRDYNLDPLRDDRPAALYHGLALGDVAAVVAYLDPLLGKINASKWIAELRAITHAPRIAQVNTAPRDQVDTLAPDTNPLTHLVSAMWISNDPLGDPNGTLDVLIAADFDRLAHRAGRGNDVLYDEANKYRTRAIRDQEWS
jgi:hypothetical protein